MQITLNESEIEDAVLAYVHKTISIPEDRNVSIDWKAGRGDHGMSATIDITQAEAPVEEPMAEDPAPKKTTRKKKPTTAKKPDPEVVEVEAETVEEPGATAANPFADGDSEDQPEVADPKEEAAEGTQPEEAEADLPKPQGGSIFAFAGKK